MFVNIIISTSSHTRYSVYQSEKKTCFIHMVVRLVTEMNNGVMVNVSAYS